MLVGVEDTQLYVLGAGLGCECISGAPRQSAPDMQPRESFDPAGVKNPRIGQLGKPHLHGTSLKCRARAYMAECVR
jgi:hypothetical protein